MPGIVGVVGPEAPEKCSRMVLQMLATLMHSPRYVQGVVSAPDVSVYAGWVAHAGSAAAQQSAVDRGDGLRLLLSGECLSPQSERSAMSAGAYPDLLALYDSLGDGFVKDLDGLFSGLVIDRRLGKVCLFNDRYSGERLYVFRKGAMTFFASEAKALLCVLPELRNWDEEGVAQFLRVGSTLDGRTLFRNLRFLQGGSMLTFQEQSVRQDRYFEPSFWECQSSLDASTFEKRFRDFFPNLLEKYFVAPGPVGISITGGLDTRMIMASLPAGASSSVCYTYCGLQGETLDAQIGRQVSEACGIEHHLIRIGEDFLRDYASYVDRTVYVTDGSGGPLQAHEIYLSQQAAAISGVRLTGNYGGEILRGVSTFKPVELDHRLLSGPMATLVGAGRSPASNIHPVTQAAFMEVPWHLFGTLAAARSELSVRTPYLDNKLVQLAYQSPATARNSSSVAEQLIRCGNARLAEIPTDQGRIPAGKDLLTRIPRRLYCKSTFKLDYWHKEGLPAALQAGKSLLECLARAGLLGQHKYLPYRGWFGAELRKYMMDVLTDPSTARAPFWSSASLNEIAVEHVRGKKNHVLEISKVMALSAVERTLMSQPLALNKQTDSNGPAYS